MRAESSLLLESEVRLTSFLSSSTGRLSDCETRCVGPSPQLHFVPLDDCAHADPDGRGCPRRSPSSAAL